MDDRPLTQMRLPPPRRRLRRPGILCVTSSQPAKDTHTHTHTHTHSPRQISQEYEHYTLIHIHLYSFSWKKLRLKNWQAWLYNPSFRDFQWETESMANEGTVQQMRVWHQDSCGMEVAVQDGAESCCAQSFLLPAFYSFHPSAWQL